MNANKLDPVGYAFTCQYIGGKTPIAEIFSWVPREAAERNHSAVQNDVATYRDVSDVFPIYAMIPQKRWPSLKTSPK